MHASADIYLLYSAYYTICFAAFYATILLRIIQKKECTYSSSSVNLFVWCGDAGYNRQISTWFETDFMLFGYIEIYWLKIHFIFTSQKQAGQWIRIVSFDYKMAYLSSLHIVDFVLFRFYRKIGNNIEAAKLVSLVNSYWGKKSILTDPKSNEITFEHNPLSNPHFVMWFLSW